MIHEKGGKSKTKKQKMDSRGRFREWRPYAGMTILKIFDLDPFGAGISGAGKYKQVRYG